MSRIPKVVWPPVMLAALFVQGGCGGSGGAWVPPETHNVKIVSEAQFVRTRGGLYLDGYFAEYQEKFEGKRMFMALDLTRYEKGERLTVTGRFADDRVRMTLDDGPAVDVAVFHVQKAEPVQWRDPTLPPPAGEERPPIKVKNPK